MNAKQLPVNWEDVEALVGTALVHVRSASSLVPSGAGAAGADLHQFLLDTEEKLDYFLGLLVDEKAAARGAS